MFELLISTGAIKLDDDDSEEDVNAMFTKKPLGGLSCASCETKLN